MLADVQAPSVLHFENMEMDLIHGMAGRSSQGNQGWLMLSDIVKKYPKHESI